LRAEYSDAVFVTIVQVYADGSHVVDNVLTLL